MSEGLIPANWMPDAAMQRIICHWTAGGPKATNLDRQHYHILIEDDGDLVRGRFSIKDNESTADGVYAAHTRGLNTGSIGLAVCCMAGAQESPFAGGSHPMTERQWQVMAKAVAELCRRYRIPVTPKTVLGHGEVQQNLGIPQRGKWDPLILPWKAHLPRQKVGTLLHHAVAAALDGADPRPDPGPRPEPGPRPDPGPGPDPETAPPLRAVVNGTPLPGAVSFDEGAYLKLSSLADLLGWRVVGADADLAVVAVGASPAELAYLGYLFLDDRDVDDADEDELVRQVGVDGYVGAVQVARILRLPIAFDFETEALVIGKGAAQAAPDPARAPLQGSFVTVKPGETLFRLAERHLGNGNRWRQLRKADGTPYTEADLPHVKIGEVVLLPDAPAARADTRPANRPAEPDVERLVAAAPPELQPFAKRSIPVIVKECLAQGVTRPAQIAYVLATAEHECKCGQFMTEIWGPTDAQISYEGRRNLGNTVAGDGYRFRGRGYVQVTGRSNYKHWADKLRLDLVARPDIVAKDPAVAAAILVRGMKEGSFCNRRLDEFIDDRRADFVKARDIINADRHIVDRGHSRDRGTRIAEIAERHFGALRT